MHAYLASLCRDCDCPAYRVGGAADHVHIATRLARILSQAQLLEKIKKTSSAWIKAQGEQYGSFFWQGGYGDFSIGWSQLEELVRYIDRQEQHTPLTPSRRSIETCCRNTGWSSMKGMFGTNAE